MLLVSIISSSIPSAVDTYGTHVFESVVSLLLLIELNVELHRQTMKLNDIDVYPSSDSIDHGRLHGPSVVQTVGSPSTIRPSYVLSL